MIDILFDLIILVISLILGVPVPFCFAAAVIFMVWTTGLDPSFLLPTGYAKLNSVTVLAILFFIMVGGVMSSGELARRLLDFTDALVGRIKGGLGVVTVVACALFGAISGTASSAVAAIGGIMIPRLNKAGYPPGYSAALVSCSAVEGQLIPPSVPMILFAWVTSQSVTACFLATVGPGIMRVVTYSILNCFLVRRMPGIENTEAPKDANKTIRLIGTRCKRASLSLIMPIIVLGSIYGGIATPTESAALALLYAIPIGLWVYRDMSLKRLRENIAESVCTTGVIVVMLFFVMILSRVYTMERVPQLISETLLNISNNKIVILIMLNVFLVIVGMLMDDISGTVLAAPLLLPVIQKLGIHPLHFAAIVGTNLGMGNITPPTAPILYLGGRVAGVSFDKMIKPLLIFLLFGSLPVLIATTYWPDLSLFLPRLLLGVK